MCVEDTLLMLLLIVTWESCGFNLISFTTSSLSKYKSFTSAVGKLKLPIIEMFVTIPVWDTSPIVWLRVKILVDTPIWYFPASSVERIFTFSTITTLPEEKPWDVLPNPTNLPSTPNGKNSTSFKFSLLKPILSTSLPLIEDILANAPEPPVPSLSKKTLSLIV